MNNRRHFFKEMRIDPTGKILSISEDVPPTQFKYTVVPEQYTDADIDELAEIETRLQNNVVYNGLTLPRLKEESDDQ